jgi:predicted RecB family nuclease
MRLVPSDYHTLYQPSRCGLRVHLKHQGEHESEPSPFAQVLFTLGQRHELMHLDTFPGALDLRGGAYEERARRTHAAVLAGISVIYQGVLIAQTVVDGVQCEVAGVTDFLIRDGDSYRIRDVKLARRINDRDHPEIVRQLELYGWLYERVFKRPPTHLEVLSGAGELVVVPFHSAAAGPAALSEILALKRASSPPREPVGWSKCGGCGFHERCWHEAEARRDVALVSGVDQALAMTLYARGIETVDQLVQQLDEPTLAGVQRPWGLKLRRVGADAEKILRMAKALAMGTEIVIATPDVPEHPNYVMFDLEGLPPHLDELEKIYLWGLQVYGEKPGDYQAGVAGFGPEGDQEGWFDFLAKAFVVFEGYGDIPIVHWHHYERVKVDLYLSRYGDVDGIGQRVRRNLVDLLPITQKAIALPLSSYSLKAVERYVGFKRSQTEYGGDWAMAKYIEATETGDREARAQIMGEILTYNREDLAATWAVLEWLKARFR